MRERRREPIRRATRAPAPLRPSLQGPPLVRCLAALEAEGETPEILVLEDLRRTHDHFRWPLPPSTTQAERAVEGLARVHAAWWESPLLGESVGDFHTKESLGAMVDGVAAKLPDLLDAHGASLPSESRRILERVFGGSREPWLRLTDRRALTVIHGDAHAWNFLFPRTGPGPAYLIDWQLWHLDVGARDLAFLIALHWYPDRRHELEAHLLRHYHESLQAHGVMSYTIEDLRLDYRRGVVRNLTIPILFWSRGMNPEGWWHRLECALSAFRDLDCEELC